jgi:membrane protease YdiL (CAAX protease family)
VEKRPGNGRAIVLLVSTGILFFPFLWGLFEGVGKVAIYLSMLLLIAAVNVLVVTKGFRRLASLLFFDILFLFYPYCLWQGKVIPYTFPGILYAAPVLIYLGIVLPARPLRITVTWFRVGRIDIVITLLILSVSSLSAAGLTGWVAVTRPDLEGFLAFIPPYPPMVLVLGGLGFALSNGFVEELIFRAVLWDVLNEAFSRAIATTLVQALFFGLWHWRGFPGGPSGMMLVFIWGLFLGWIRRRSGGMLAPFICHVCADLTIFAILAVLSQR